MTTPIFQGADRLELLNTFITIVDSKNLSSAAVALNTTQPTVSRRLGALEKGLGIKLIHRTTHQMQLTEEGRQFYQHAKEIIERWSQIEAEMTGAKVSPKGTLRVQVPQALGIGKFNHVLSKYLETYKETNIEWSLSDRMPDFLSENLDCAIKVGNIDDPNMVAIKIMDLQRVIVASSKLIKDPKKYDHPKKLEELSWLSFNLHYTDSVSLFQTKTKQKCTLNIHPRFSTDNLFSIRESIASGLGIGVISKWVVEKDLAEGSIVQLCKNWEAPSLPVYLIYPQSSLKPAKLQKFVELLKP